MAVRLICRPEYPECRFELVRGARECARARPDEGTVSRGVGRSPWTGEALPEDYIKAEAQADRMGAQLYALGIQRPDGRKDFRLPTEDDLAAVRAAEEELRRRWPEWEARGLIPTEPIPEQINDPRPLHYGMRRWCDLFSPRQLLALVTYLEALLEVKHEIYRALPEEKARAVVTYLAFVLNKCANYNSRMSVWHPSRSSVANTFDRHDFSFKWSHGEITMPGDGWPWALEQVVDAYRGLARLLAPAQQRLGGGRSTAPEKITITLGNAADLPHIPDGAVHAVVVDPPYYDNVMYAELSDFFYVWMKRSLADVYPDYFIDELTNKDEEAVANPARFAALGGKKKKEMADEDYRRKMAAVFRECHRILRDDGVLTVMFTHKRVDAWDALATALLNAGFAVRASWPVHTESEHSLHQAKKNAAASTILLVCRKRPPGGEPAWWDDLRGRVRRVARQKAEEFQKQGLKGADLYIATFGPVLGVLSESWPVYTSELDPATGQPRLLRPEAALDVARREVVSLRRQGLLLGRSVEFDPVTDWYLMAWDAFRAAEFPADEARKLALALGLDVERDLVQERRIIAKKGSTVVLQEPRLRRRRGRVDPDLRAFECWLDAAHTAMLVLEEDGDRACRAFLERAGLLRDGTFASLLQAMVNAIPRVRQKGRLVRPEAEALDKLRLLFYPDLQVPPEPEVPAAAQFRAPVVEGALAWTEPVGDDEEEG